MERKNWESVNELRSDFLATGNNLILKVDEHILEKNRVTFSNIISKMKSVIYRTIGNQK